MIKNEEIQKLIEVYNGKISATDIILKHIKETLDKVTDEDLRQDIKRSRIHHKAERQCFVQTISDLEGLDIAIED